MPKGVPKSGERKLHQRWTLKRLLPLQQRWLVGEKLYIIAKEANTSPGRLRSAMITFGLEIPPSRNGSYRPRRPRRTRDYDSNHIVSESLKLRDFDAAAHRSARHYKGSFDL